MRELVDVDNAICAFFIASSICWSSLSIVSNSSLIARACSTDIGVRPVKAYFAANSSTWYFSLSRSMTFIRSAAKRDRSPPAQYQSRSSSRSCSSAGRLSYCIAQFFGRRDAIRRLAIDLGRFLANLIRFVGLKNLLLPL
ncbi:MAG: hypothetical protein QM775_14065 [Pirellulales bacterium]